MKTLLIFISTVFLLAGCMVAEPEYRSEIENQLTAGEEQQFSQIGKLYIIQNYRKLGIRKNEIEELKHTKPTVRAYCRAYKYGEANLSWLLKNGTTIMVRANGYLLDGKTPLDVKITRAAKTLFSKKKRERIRIQNNVEVKY